MGARGPHPLPTKILKLRGSRRGKAPHEPKTGPMDGSCPELLKGRAREMWDDLSERLIRVGVAGELDRNALARYCLLWARWMDLEAFVAKNGEVYEANGLRKLHPEAAEARQLAALLARLEDGFGMNPSARSRVRAKPGEHQETGDKSRFFGGT